MLGGLYMFTRPPKAEEEHCEKITTDKNEGATPTSDIGPRRMDNRFSSVLCLFILGSAVMKSMCVKIHTEMIYGKKD